MSTRQRSRFSGSPHSVEGQPQAALHLLSRLRYPAVTVTRAWLVLWICFLARGVFYSALMPIWEGWDEWSHVAYIEYVVDTGGLPDPNSTRLSRELMASFAGVAMPHGSTYAPSNGLTHAAYWSLPDSERAERRRALSAIPGEWRYQQDPAGEILYEAQQPPLYYWLMAAPATALRGASLPVRVYTLRLASVLLSSLALWFGFAAARRVFGSDGMAGLVTALVVSMPGLLINVARVGNESLAIPLATLLFYLTLRTLEEPAQKRWYIAAGVVLGACLLTKVYFLAMLPALALVFALRRLWFGMVTLLIGVGISLWWYVRIYMLTDTWTGQIQTVAARRFGLGERIAAVFRADWGHSFDSLLLSHIWMGGWSFLQVRSWMYHFFYVVFAVALIGLVLLAVRRKFAPLLPAAALLAFLVMGLTYHALIEFLLSGDTTSAGWYLFALVFPEAVLLAGGLAAFGKRWVPAALVACFVALELYATHFVLMPYSYGVTGFRQGRLGNFHLAEAGLLAERAAGLLPLWIPYLAATVAVAVIAFGTVRKERALAATAQ